MTMGPPQAEAALRTCLALGADRCIHLSDRVFAVADTLGTSRTLALAIEKEGDVDLVVCGRKTIDSETWQVPPEIGGVPRLAAPDERRRDRAGGRRPARDAGDGRRLRDLGAADTGCRLARLRPTTPRRRRRGARSTSGRRPTSSTTCARTTSASARPGSPTRVLAVRDVTPERAGERFTASTPRSHADRARSLHERALEPTQLGQARAARRAARRRSSTTAGRSSSSPAAARRAPRWSCSARAASCPESSAATTSRSCSAPDVTRRGARAPRRRPRRPRRGRPRSTDYDPQLLERALRAVVEQQRPHVLLIPATANGRDIGPRVAGELGARHDRRLRRARHRSRRPADPDEAGVRRQHRLRDHGRDDAAARDGAPADVRAARAARRRGDASRRIELDDVSAAARHARRARGRRRHATSTRPTSSSASARSSPSEEIARARELAEQRRRRGRRDARRSASGATCRGTARSGCSAVPSRRGCSSRSASRATSRADRLREGRT